MENRLKELHHILERLVGLYRQLLDTSRAEYEGLVNFEKGSVQEAILAKEAIIQSLQETENERLALMSDIALSIRKPIDRLRLIEVVTQYQAQFPEICKKLKTTHSTLKLLIERTKEQNDDNKALVENALTHVVQMKNHVLSNSEDNPNLYTSKGKSHPHKNRSKLLSKEA